MKKVSEFVLNYLYPAKRAGGAYGVPYLLILAQAALESGWGKKAPGFNFFGIKDSTLIEYGVQTFDTTEVEGGKEKKVKDKFEVFPDVETAFKVHSQLLVKRWPNALGQTDPIEFIKIVQNDYSYKYATDPDYVDKIASIAKMIQHNIEFTKLTSKEAVNMIEAKKLEEIALNDSKVEDVFDKLAKVKVNAEGINEFLDVLKALVKGLNIFKEVRDPESAGGKDITITEYFKFTALIGYLKDAIVGIDKVPAQLMDLLTEDEQKQINEVFAGLEYLKKDQNVRNAFKDHLAWIESTKQLLTIYYF